MRYPDDGQHYWRRKVRALLPWLILAVAATATIVLGAVRRAFSVFISAFSEEFNTTTNLELNFIGDTYTALTFFLTPVVTNLLVQFDRAYRLGMLLACVLTGVSCVSSSFVPSPSVLFATFSLVFGVASALIMCCAILVVGEYFDRKHSLHVFATTIISGGAYGAMLFGTLLGHLVDRWGWRWTFRALGVALCIACAPAIVFYYPKKREDSAAEEIDGNESTSTAHNESASERKLDTWKKRPIWTTIPWKHLKKNWQIPLWIADRVIYNIVLYSLVMNLVNWMKDSHSISIGEASRITLVWGGGDSLVFTLGVVFGDRIQKALVWLNGACALLAVALILALVFTAHSVAVVYTLTFFLGFTVGSGNTCLYAISEQVVRLHGSQSYASTRLMAGVGVLLSPLASGVIIDRHGYPKFLLVQAILCACRVVLMVAIGFMLRARNRRCEQKRLARQGSSQTEDTALLVAK